MAERTETTEDDAMPPVTPSMVQEQLERIRLEVRIEDMVDWSEPLCATAFDWAVDVEIAWMDGNAVSIGARPAELTLALEQAGNPPWVRSVKDD
jgi:hypothetical protein